MKKFINHLWYLTPESSAMAFFDTDLSNEQKRKMVCALKSDSKFISKKRILVHENDLNRLFEPEIHDFVSETTLNFFTRFQIDTTFLLKDPSV